MSLRAITDRAKNQQVFTKTAQHSGLLQKEPMASKIKISPQLIPKNRRKDSLQIS